jgi:hypothetical protein
MGIIATGGGKHKTGAGGRVILGHLLYTAQRPRGIFIGDPGGSIGTLSEDENVRAAVDFYLGASKNLGDRIYLCRPDLVMAALNSAWLLSKLHSPLTTMSANHQDLHRWRQWPLMPLLLLENRCIFQPAAQANSIPLLAVGFQLTQTTKNQKCPYFAQQQLTTKTLYSFLSSSFAILFPIFHKKSPPSYHHTLKYTQLLNEPITQVRLKQLSYTQ